MLSLLPIIEQSARGESLNSSNPDTAMLNDVSGLRLTHTVGDLAAFQTRAFYTNSSWNSSIYIHDRFVELGLWVYYQDLVVSGFAVRNVVAVKNGSDTNVPQYLFGAHYDSTNKQAHNFTEGEILVAPGADDDASGVAAVVELATILRNSTFGSTLKFVAFAAEESGLNGSRYFAEGERADNIAYADTVILDMIGFRLGTENRIMIFRDASDNTLASSIPSAIDYFGLSLSTTTITGHDMVYSDHASFWADGYPSLLIIEQLVDLSPANPYYHTSEDTLDHLSADQMVEVTRAVLGGFILLENPVKPKHDSTLPVIIGAVIIASVIVSVIYLSRHRKVEE